MDSTHLKSSNEIHKKLLKNKEVFLNPISEIDTKIVFGLVDIIQKLGINIKDDFDSYKLNPDKELLEVVNQIKKKVSAKNQPKRLIEEESSNKEHEKVFLFSDLASTAFNLRYYTSSRTEIVTTVFDKIEYRIVINPSVVPAPHTNIVVKFSDIDLMEEEYSNFLESLK